MRLPDRRALELASRVVRRWLGAMDRLAVERGWRGALGGERPDGDGAYLLPLNGMGMEQIWRGGSPRPSRSMARQDPDALPMASIEAAPSSRGSSPGETSRLSFTMNDRRALLQDDGGYGQPSRGRSPSPAAAPGGHAAERQEY